MLPDCNPEKTSSIRCKSPQDSHRGCLIAKMRYFALERVTSGLSPKFCWKFLGGS